MAWNSGNHTEPGMDSGASLRATGPLFFPPGAPPCCSLGGSPLGLARSSNAEPAPSLWSLPGDRLESAILAADACICSSATRTFPISSRCAFFDAGAPPTGRVVRYQGLSVLAKPIAPGAGTLPAFVECAAGLLLPLQKIGGKRAYPGAASPFPSDRPIASLSTTRGQ